MSTVLGLDLGPNSIGWALISTDKNEIIGTGVRIFPEGVENYGKAGQQESKNTARRNARGMRKQNSRYRMRRDYLLCLLKKFGLYPSSSENESAFYQIDPYDVRDRGINQKLSAEELCRAIFHLNQRRGFKSNRKTDSGEDTKIHKGADGVIGISGTEKAIIKGGFKSLGAYLASLNPRELRRRSRYTTRKMYEDEFDLLIENQKKYHLNLLTEKTIGTLKKAIFSQRKLKSQKDNVRKCTFEPLKKCSPKSTPVFQEYRILEQLSRLKLSAGDRHNEPLTQDEKDLLCSELIGSEAKTFKQISKILGLTDETIYNLEHEKKLIGHRTFHQIRKAVGKSYFNNLTREQKQNLWHNVYFAEDHEWLKNHGIKSGLTMEQAEKYSKIKLEKEYCHLSKKAMENIIPFMKRAITDKGEPMTFDKAAKLAGYDHSNVQDRSGNQMKLPNPENIRNPIVQQALFELKKVVNDIIEEYGNPEQIKVEMVRELKLPRKRREKIFSENKKREKEHKRIKDTIIDIGGDPTYDSILKYKLWEECEKIDPFTGDRINSVSQLFNGEYEIEHILPYSKSLDNSFMNKTLCRRDINAQKGNRTPWEVWSDTSQYKAILERAKKLPYPKYKRFLQKHVKEDQFLNRQLNDTAYIAKEVRIFLWKICEDVRVVPGTATARLRLFWGLNSILSRSIDIKNREDHRHHAVDALVVANTNQGFVQKLSLYNEYDKEPNPEKFPFPWDNFRADAEKSINRILVSHKQRSRVRGKLHEETNYGQIEINGEKHFVVRKPLISITNQNGIKNIVDEGIKRTVLKHLEKFSVNIQDDKFTIPKEVFKTPVYMKGSKIPIRKVRIKVPSSNMRQLYKDRKLFVEPGSNHHMELFQHPETGHKTGRVVTLFDAVKRKKDGTVIYNKIPGDEIKEYEFFMTLKMNDMVLLGVKEEDIDWNNEYLYKSLSSFLYRVQKMAVNCQIVFRHHLISLSGESDPGIERRQPNKFVGIKVVISNSGLIKPVND